MAQDIQNADRICVETSVSASSVGIRPVVPGDGPAVHALLTAAIPDVLPDRARWLNRWRWQYWQNPYREDRPAGWVFAEGEQILGHLGAVYVPLRVGDRCVTGVIGADYAVSEEMAARAGVFAALELAQKLFTECGTCMVLATTANEKTGAVFGRFGCRPVEWTREFWRAPATLTQQIRSCCGGGNRVLRRLMTGGVGSLFMRALTGVHRMARYVPGLPIPRGCRLETTVPQLARDLGHLWEQIIAAGLAGSGAAAWPMWRTQLSIERSQAYLDWRYGQHPEREHVRVLVVRDAQDTPLAAAIVFREHRDDRHVFYVEDIIVPPHRTDVLRTLLCAALRLAYDHGAEYLVTTPGRVAIRDVFWELGFELRARNAPAAVLYMSSSSVEVSASAPPGFAPHEHFEFWHGMMF